MASRAHILVSVAPRCHRSTTGEDVGVCPTRTPINLGSTTQGPRWSRRERRGGEMRSRQSGLSSNTSHHIPRRLSHYVFSAFKLL